MSRIGIFAAFREDLKRHFDDDMSLPAKAKTILTTQGIWATAVYRFGQWVYGEAPGPVRAPLKLGYLVASKMVEMTTGISVPASANIGPGFYIGHFGTIIVHPDTVMGTPTRMAVAASRLPDVILGETCATGVFRGC